MKKLLTLIILAACAAAHAGNCGNSNCGGRSGSWHACIEPTIDPSVLKPKKYPDATVRLTFQGVSRAAMHDALVAEFALKGSDLEQEGESMLTFVKESKNPLANMWVATRYDDRVFFRARIYLIKTAAGLQVNAKEDIVSNYHSAFEQTIQYRDRKELTNLEALINRAADRAK